jgi:MoaA/NifB/PqqE/SkfB family radical SAM enzyme
VQSYWSRLEHDEEDLTPVESRILIEEVFERAEGLIDREDPMQILSTGNDSVAALLLIWIEEHWGKQPAARARETLRRRGGNAAGERVFAIDRVGQVHPDQFWQASSLGDLREQPLDEILAHPLRKELAEREQSCADAAEAVVISTSAEARTASEQRREMAMRGLPTRPA